MRQFYRKLRNVFQKRNTTVRKAQPSVRLWLEALEDRCVPTANASGTLSGVTFLDANHNGVYDGGDPALPAVQVTLTGKTTVGTTVSVSESTDPSGSYSFVNVLPGTYQVSAVPLAGLANGLASFSGVAAAPGVNTSSPIVLGGGQSVLHNLGFQGSGLVSPSVNMSLFLTSTTAADFPFSSGTPGTGQTLVNFRGNNTPIVSSAIAPVSVSVSAAATQIDLAGHFKDPDANNPTFVTFNTTDGPLVVQMFDNIAPQTVANFLDYVKLGNYNNMLFNRLAKNPDGTNFVLQGGAATLHQSGGTFSLTPTTLANPPVPGEVSLKNVFGTLAMALPGNPPSKNAGTDEFFINLGTNSSLDPNFTVFGKVVDSSFAVLNALTSAKPTNETGSTFGSGAPNAALNELPLQNYNGTHFPTDATANNFLTVHSFTVSQPEFLTYSVVSNSNPTLVLPAIVNERLALHYVPGHTGTATVVVRATDRFGAFVQQTITVTVAPKPPVISAVSIAVDNPANAMILTANPTATDPQNLSITFTYQWLQNGAPITVSGSGATTKTLDVTKLTLAVNDKLSVQVTPSDSALTGTLFTSPTKNVTSVGPPITIA
jgi:peptidyl-prolyl cis-trans isomerase A (cyclophilin A)